jgi:hypothetical protein
VFPVDFKNVYKVRGPRLRILKQGEEEPIFDPKTLEDELEDEDDSPKSPWEKASENFC